MQPGLPGSLLLHDPGVPATAVRGRFALQRQVINSPSVYGKGEGLGVPQALPMIAPEQEAAGNREPESRCQGLARSWYPQPYLYSLGSGWAWCLAAKYSAESHFPPLSSSLLSYDRRVVACSVVGLQLPILPP